MQKLNDVKQYKVKLLDMGRKDATRFLVSCKVAEDVFDYFVELFCDFRRAALGKSGQLFHLYTIDANILRDMVSPLLGHLEGGRKIDIVWAAWADSRDQISKTKTVHCAEGC